MQQTMRAFQQGLHTSPRLSGQKVVRHPSRPIVSRQPRTRTGAAAPERGPASSLHARRETEEEAIARRLRESEEVEQRVKVVSSPQEIEEAINNAGNKLVIVEIQGEEVCETGLMEEVEMQWKGDQKMIEAKKLEACEKIKSTFQRTARECKDTDFLEVHVSDDEEGRKLMDELGVSMLPTIQYYKDGKLLWEQRGSVGMEQGLGEGLLFVGNQGAQGMRTEDYVRELTGLNELREFVADGADQNILKVVMVGTTCKPAIKAFPALLALARGFSHSGKRITDFARLLVEDSETEVKPEMKELRILEVPTFIFYRFGKETGRLVSSSRGDLIGTILQQLSDAGISPPPPPPANATAGAAKRRDARTVQKPKRNPWK